MNTYIGARYVPIFGRKDESSIQWDNTKPYEPLTVVLYQGDSYTSRQAVPIGIDISNEEFWALTGNYNAQIEQYRTEVAGFNERITANSNAISAETLAREGADDTLDDRIDEEVDALEQSIQTLGGNLSTETLNRENADTALGDRITSEAQARADADALLATKAEVEGLVTQQELTTAVSGLSSQTYVDNTRDTILDGLKLLRNRYVLCVGDSLTKYGNIDKHWPAYLSDMSGATTYNYAVGGASFGKQDNNITTQVNNAASAASVPNDRITDVVIIGGYNDYAQSSSAVSTGLVNAIQAARTGFPNARIHVGAMLHGTAPLNRPIGAATATQPRSPFLSIISDIASRYNCIWIDGCWYWMVGRTAYDYGDGIHTTAGGQAVIASYMYSHLCGGSTNRVCDAFVELSQSAPSGFTDGDCHVYASGGIITVTGKLVKGSEAAENGLVFQLPEWAYHGNTGPSVTSQQPCALIGDRITADATAIPRIYINSTGGVTVQNMGGMGTLAESIFFNMTYPFGI